MYVYVIPEGTALRTKKIGVRVITIFQANKIYIWSTSKQFLLHALDVKLGLLKNAVNALNKRN